MKLNRSHTVLGVLAVLASVAMGSNARAEEDWKSIPGAACQAWHGDQERDIIKSAAGAVNISPTENRLVSCLTVRDNARNKVGTSGAWIYVVQAATQTTTCSNRSANLDGSEINTVTDHRMGPGLMPIDAVSSADLGTYVIICDLPPGARISTILLLEYR